MTFSTSWSGWSPLRWPTGDVRPWDHPFLGFPVQPENMMGFAGSHSSRQISLYPRVTRGETVVLHWFGFGRQLFQRHLAAGAGFATSSCNCKGCWSLFGTHLLQPNVPKPWESHNDWVFSHGRHWNMKNFAANQSTGRQSKIEFPRVLEIRRARKDERVLGHQWNRQALHPADAWISHRKA